MTTHHEHILVVDDDELVRTGLAADLEAEGYHVSTAASGREALSVLEQQRVDLILSDLVMNEMDGLELLQWVRRQMPDIGFIMITGHGTIARALEAMRTGANDFVQKPADPDVIKHRVRSVLNSLHLRRKLIEERRRTEDRKEELRKRLVREQRMTSLGRLADGISLYLRTIVEPVVQAARAVLDELDEAHPIRKRMQEIDRAGRKAMSLIHDLETVGHVSQTAFEPVDLVELVREYLRSPDLQRLLIDVPPVRIEYESAVTTAMISGSRPLLTVMLANLLSYGIDGMPDGGTLRVRLNMETLLPSESHETTAGTTPYVVIRVEHTGWSAPRDRERVFEPFQSRTIKGHTASTGLGLSVIYRVVQDHHGYINLQTTPLGDTEFVLYFPVTRAEGPVPGRPEQLSDLIGHETVLVVDDYKDHREAAAAILQNLGYRVLTAGNGREAVAHFQKTLNRPEQRIDLVVLDLVLADAMDGLETYKQIVDIVPGQKAVLVSGFAEFDRIVEARKLGLKKYIQKPYRTEPLAQAVRSELDRD